MQRSSQTIDYWNNKLKSQLTKDDGTEKTSVALVDIEALSTSVPMRIWQQAGLNSQSVKEATPVTWMYCGAFFTRELLAKMKKVKSSACACDNETSEDLTHFILNCKLYGSIRQQYIPQYLQMNNNVLSICDNQQLVLLSILDPLSSKLPEIITKNWSSVSAVYELSRKFIYRMHLKREKISKKFTKNYFQNWN